MMGDRYVFEEEKYRVVGHHTGTEYRMGQNVKVQVMDADKQLGTIDFAMITEE